MLTASRSGIWCIHGGIGGLELWRGWWKEQAGQEEKDYKLDPSGEEITEEEELGSHGEEQLGNTSDEEKGEGEGDAHGESSQLLSDDNEDMEDSKNEGARSELEGRAAERERAAAFALTHSRQPCLRRKSHKL